MNLFRGRILWGVLCGVLLNVGLASFLAAYTPSQITFQATLISSQANLLQGPRSVGIRICDGQTQIWPSFGSEVEIRNVQFVNGSFSLLLGADTRYPLTPDVFNIPSPNLRVKVRNPQTGNWSAEARFPLSALPYAVQTAVADTVLRVNASQVSGAFTNPVVMSNDVLFGQGVVIISSNAGVVGIGITPTSGYKLNVGGIVNATGFRINGDDIETSLLWKRQGADLYYTSGNVGIGTSNPQYQLDVAGTLNAKGFRLNGQDLGEALKSQLAWRGGVGNNIYYDTGAGVSSGRVGIGTSEPVERLDVVGGIRIGTSVSTRPLAGTIQYKDGDFQGYTTRQRWESLTGIQGTGQPGQLVFWSAAKTVSGLNNLVWLNEQLGIGTGTPNARVHIQARATENALDIRDATNNVLLFVGNNGRVGIGTSTPISALDVKGVVDAQDFLVNGQPIGTRFSTGSFWKLENRDGVGERLFYDTGRVGIGTSNPQSLLELASSVQNPAITFDIGGVNLFSIGVSTQNGSSFVISKGGDLSIPVFTFQGQSIGIGTTVPSATLHVSGNTGVVFTGTFGSTEVLPEIGSGAKFLWYPANAALRVGRVTTDNWNQAFLGVYSVGLGNNPLAVGTASVVAGGQNNTASGNYSFVAGGLDNVAGGELSFAAGRGARALHRGSFVWADYLVSDQTTPFDSRLENQFIIRATNGVGIGTSNTLGSALTVVASSGYIFRSFGDQARTAFAVRADGAAGIGTLDLDAVKFAVSGSVGIGTTEPGGYLTIRTPLGSTRNPLVVYPAADVSNNPSSTAAILVNYEGRVAIGYTDGFQFPTSPNSRLYVNGPVASGGFKIVDPNDPNATITLNPIESPWSVKDGNVYRSQGRIGIGTATPSTLLTLSNQNLINEEPVLLFDIGGVPQYSLGVTYNSLRSDRLFVISKGGSLTATSGIAISGSGVGIGTGLVIPRTALDVSGNVYVAGSLSIATTNFDSTYRLNVGGGLNVRQLYIDGVLFQPVNDPWLTSGQDIYYTSGNVGLGVSTPDVRLAVDGTISANTMILSRPITLGSDLAAKRILLQEINTQNRFGVLEVAGSEFIYTNPSGNRRSISETLQKGTGNTGEMAYWVDGSTLGRSSVFWDDPSLTLRVTGNLSVARFQQNENFRVTTNAKWGGDSAFELSAVLSHDGAATPNGVNRSFTSERIAVDVNRSWGGVDAVQVKGLDIKLQSLNGTSFLNQATAVGLYVDVSSVNVSTTPGLEGFKYAAIFLGGNVGIGTSQPQSALEVNGTVSANFFNLSGGLSVPQLTVSNSAFVARSSGSGRPRIGIGVTNPEAFDSEFTVAGTISANVLQVAGGLTAGTANIGNGTLVINEAGNIGIGTTVPGSQIDIRRNIQDPLIADFVSQRINIAIDGSRPGNIFYLNRNLTGLDIALSSVLANRLGANATGISVDLSSIQTDSLSRVEGLNVNVAGATGTRYAAIFNGGRVGIGTTQPQAELDVSGSIKADGLILRGNLQANSATFNTLLVNRAATFNGVVTINSLVVSGTITANQLVIATTLNATDGVFKNIRGTTAVFTGLASANQVIVSSSLTGNFALFSGGVGIGVSLNQVPTSGLLVSGNLTAKSLDVTDLLTLRGSTLNIMDSLGNTGAFVGSDGRLGVGTSQPSASMHLVSSTGQTFDAGSVTTWGLVRVQAPRSAVNVAAGLALVPDATSSLNVASGIVAIRAADGANVLGSHLAFITDPISGVPQERMRITEAGRVGIGITAPTAALDVSGDVRIGGALTVDGGFTLSRIEGTDSLIVSPGSVLQIEGPTSINAALRVKEALYLDATIATPSASSDYGILYVNKDDKNLYYLKPGSVSPISLSGLFTGTVGRIPYINSAGYLASDAPVYWNPISQRFTVGDASGNVAGIDLAVTINNAAYAGLISGHRIDMNFLDRSGVVGAQDVVFSGLDINLAGKNPNDVNGFGRLGNGETAVGLRVDMRTLATSQFDISGNPLSGHKYAALFIGGGVGIGTANPDAALHVVNSVAGNTPFRVSGATPYALVVSDRGNVGIGLSDPSAKLTVKGDTSDTSAAAFALLATANTAPFFSTLLYVRNDGNVGVGTANPTAKLHVIGDVSANSGSFTSAEVARTLNVGAGKFVVTSGGLVGVGTANPTAQLHMVRSFTASDLPSTDFIAQKAEVTFGNGQPNTQLLFSRNITLMDLSMRTAVGSTLGISATDTSNVVGLNIDLSKQLLGAASVAQGIYVDVTGTTGTRYAATFLGGNVGIGTTNPTVALEVSGDIRANSLILSAGFESNSITVGTLSVTQSVTINGSVTASRIFADIVSANTAILASLTVPTASVSTLTVSTAILLKSQTTAPAASANYASLYVDDAGDLIYRKPATSNVTKLTGLGPAGRVPYYDASGVLSPSSNITWSDTSKTLTVQGGFNVDSTITSTANADSSLQSLKMHFGNRGAVSGSLLKFVGMDIAFDSLDPTSNFSFGRLADGEEAIGLRVDMSSLRAKYTQELDLTGDVGYQGYKYAAAFIGGNVGIGTTTPSSMLHVVHTTGAVFPLRVDSASANYALTVTSTGSVGLGTSAPEAQLSLVVPATFSRAVSVVSSNGTASLFSLLSNGRLGVGTANPTSLVHLVSPDTSVNAFQVDAPSVPGAFVVSSNGFVGIGVPTPAALLHVNSSSSSPMFRVSSATKDFAFLINAAGSVGIGVSTPLYPLSVDGVVMVGTANSNAAAQVPAWLATSVQTTRGFLANSGSDNLFFGVRQRTGDASRSDSVLWWGKDTTDALFFEYTDAVSATSSAMAIYGNGRVFVGENRLQPSANLHIQSKTTEPPFRIDVGSNLALVVSQNGFVGIGTSNPTVALHVVGSLVADTVRVLKDTLTVSTLNLSQSFRLDASVSQNVAVTAHIVNLVVSSDVQSDITAMDISIDASQHATLARKYAIYNNASAIGLKVDVSGVLVKDPSLPADKNPGKKIAALFSGGFVGIGPDPSFLPEYPLHILAPPFAAAPNAFADIARFSGQQGGVTLRDYGNAKVGFYSQTGNSIAPSYLTLLFAPSDTPGPGRVGIGTTAPDKTLVVAGDVRVGVVTSANGVGTVAGPGSTLFFSGGPILSSSFLNSDNGVPLYMRRFNLANGQSDLQVAIGTNGVGTANNASGNRFVVGYQDVSGYTPVLDVRTDGRVGIDGRTNRQESNPFTPQVSLHVASQGKGAADTLSSYAAVIENSNTSAVIGDSVQGLALVVTNNVASVNYVSFFRGSTLVGAIQGDTPTSGVQYMTQGADYAEYLPKLNPKEAVEKGDILGVANGKVSKHTTFAQQVMVRSAAASVVGNWPGQDKVKLYELVSFFGQVPVKVRGVVHKGDLILPSGLGDGTGVAVAPEAVKPEEYHLIVGTAWEESEKTEVKLIHSAVGFNFSMPKLGQSLSKLDTLQRKVTDLEQEQSTLTQKLDKQLADQNQQIERLLNALKQ